MKTAAQQEIVALHRIREQWHGIPLAAGPRAALAAVPTLAEQLPAQLALAVTSVYDACGRWKRAWSASSDSSQRWPRTTRRSSVFLEIPGIGLLTATALVGSVGRITSFRRARQFASWLTATHHQRRFTIRT